MGAARPGDRWQEGFWDAIDRGEIMIQRCPADHYQFPGGPNCARCGRETRWTPIEGTARIWSSVVFHHRYFDAFSDMVPYPVLLLELSEGPRMYTGLHPEETLEPRIGAAVGLEIIDYPFGPVPMARLTRDPQDRPKDGGER